MYSQFVLFSICRPKQYDGVLPHAPPWPHLLVRKSPPSLTPTLGWLLHCLIKWQPSKGIAPPISLSLCLVILDLNQGNWPLCCQALWCVPCMEPWGDATSWVGSTHGERGQSLWGVGWWRLMLFVVCFVFCLLCVVCCVVFACVYSF